MRAASIGGSLERRWLGDRLAVSGTATSWLPIAGDAAVTGFDAIGTRVSVGTHPVARGWRFLAAAGVDRVSDNAPMTLWPGAGEGWARSPLLRAHPLLDDGVIDVSGRTVFGRSVRYASAEAQRWLDRPVLTRVGVAAFVDVAQASRQLTPTTDGRTQADVGTGLRIRLPGDARILRVDFAHGIRDGANAFSLGWVF